jgi:hypothetical protein
MRERGEARARTSLRDRHERDIAPLLDADRLAEWLGLASGRQALDLARRRLLPFVKLGKRILFRRDGVLKALEKAEICAIPDAELGGQD